MLEVKDVSVNYEMMHEKKALDKVSFTVEKGEILAVIGPSGCGKSTLLKAIAGILKGYGGAIEWNGVPVDTTKNLVGYIPQGYGLIPWKNVMENCLLPMKIRGVEIDPHKRELVKNLMDSLEIGGLAKRYPATLSGGEKQRVALIRGLSLSPQILLMDEPFSALDAILRDEAAETFLKVWKENQNSTILITHSIDEAIYLGHRIAIMATSPGRMKKILPNPLYGVENYKERDEYKEMYHRIKTEIREGEML